MYVYIVGKNKTIKQTNFTENNQNETNKTQQKQKRQQTKIVTI